jgi:outer membrane murein-binding lipoprotein Lpp
MNLAPKREALENAFFLYRAEHKNSLLVAGKQDKQKLKDLGAKWAALPAQQKQVYDELAKKNREAYQARFDAWKASKPDEFAEYEAVSAT